MISTHLTFNRFLSEYRLLKLAFHHRVRGASLIEMLLIGMSPGEVGRISGLSRAAVQHYFAGIEAMMLRDGYMEWAEILSSLPPNWVQISDDLERFSLQKMTGRIGLNKYHRLCRQTLTPLELTESIVDWIALVSNRIMIAPVILDFLRHGHSGIRKAFGIKTDNPFELYITEPELMRVYSQAFSRSNASDLELFERVSDATFGHVLDLGGGSGSTLANLLRSKCAAQATATVYDNFGSNVALSDIRAKTLGDLIPRVRFVEGNFLSKGNRLAGLGINESFDLIVLGWILHDWPDKTAIQILKKVRRHLKPGGILFVLEDIKVGGEEALTSLIMFLMMKGQERTHVQFVDLFAKAGFTLKEVLSPKSGARSLLIVEAR